MYNIEVDLNLQCNIAETVRLESLQRSIVLPFVPVPESFIRFSSNDNADTAYAAPFGIRPGDECFDGYYLVSGVWFSESDTETTLKIWHPIEHEKDVDATAKHLMTECGFQPSDEYLPEGRPAGDLSSPVGYVVRFKLAANVASDADLKIPDVQLIKDLTIPYLPFVGLSVFFKRNRNFAVSTPGKRTLGSMFRVKGVAFDLKTKTVSAYLWHKAKDLSALDRAVHELINVYKFQLSKFDPPEIQDKD